MLNKDTDWRRTTLFPTGWTHSWGLDWIAAKNNKNQDRGLVLGFEVMYNDDGGGLHSESRGGEEKTKVDAEW